MMSNATDIDNLSSSNIRDLLSTLWHVLLAFLTKEEITLGIVEFSHIYYILLY